MRLCFSRDRAAQLDLLLRSLDRNAPPGDTAVLWRGSNRDYRRGYEICAAEHPLAALVEESDFDFALRLMLSMGSTKVCFFCDDDVVYRPVPSLGADVLARYDEVLTFSLRLGYGRRESREWEACTYPLDSFETDRAIAVSWEWSKRPPHDHGYPGSIDGHTFRTADILRMIDGQTIGNPLMLETILAHRCTMLADERPLMACYPEQALVGVPVNTVADDQRRPHGDMHPQPAAELNRRYLAGERIELREADYAGVDGCLHEVPFRWTQRVTA